MLATGDVMPEFTLKDQEGHEVNGHALIGDKILIIYFYPKDFTPGCIREACSFRDNMEKFVDSGARVVGISADSVGTHRKFAKSFNLDYLLLSDPDRVVHQKFGIPSSFFGLLSGRVTFVVGLDGVVKFALESQFQPLKHVYNSLKAVKELREGI